MRLHLAIPHIADRRWREVIVLVRKDEARHRDVDHGYAEVLP